jgi:hypothetical protein
MSSLSSSVPLPSSLSSASAGWLPRLFSVVVVVGGAATAASNRAATSRRLSSEISELSSTASSFGVAATTIDAGSAFMPLLLLRGLATSFLNIF